MVYGASLQLTLPIQCSGEGLIVERALHCPRPSVGGHALDAILCLVSRKLTTELISSDVGLGSVCVCVCGKGEGGGRGVSENSQCRDESSY